MSKIKKSKIVVLAGPTASGKSDLAIRLARRFNGEIVSADSRQVYRGMDIGTGKVTKAEQKLVRHWMLDIASPTRQYSVARFKREAQRAIRNIVHRGKLPIICGGTGFWIDALVYDLAVPDTRPNAPLRARLQKLSLSQMFARLQKLDPVRASSIDPHNGRRLIRALEIVMTTGQPVPPRTNGSPYEPFSMAISVPQQTLAARIAKRLRARLKSGMLAEVRHLHTNGVSWKKLEGFGLEYRWLAQYLQKKITRREMQEELLRDIIKYSKRQMTWFRRNSDIVWVHTPAQSERLTNHFLTEK